MFAPSDYDTFVYMPDDPITCAWRGGAILASRDDFITNYCVTKEEFDEFGPLISLRRFFPYATYADLAHAADTVSTNATEDASATVAAAAAAAASTDVEAPPILLS